MDNYFKNPVLKNILYLIIAAPALFLLVNRYQYFGIISFVVILALGVFFLFYKKRITQYHFELIFILAILYMYFTLSYFVSNQTAADFFSYEFLRKDGNFFFNYLPFFALAVPFFDYKKAADLFFKFLLVTFPLASAIGIVEFLTGRFELFFGIQNREEVFLVLNRTHNATGSVYAVVSLFALAFLLKEKIKVKKILYGLALLLCLAGLLLTRSRGSYIGFAAGAVMVLWLYYRSILKFILTLLAMGAVSAPIIFFTGTFDRIKTIFDLEHGTNAVRVVMWERAWDLFTKSPLFGIGFGRYNDILYENFWWDRIPSLEYFVGWPGIVSFYMEPEYVFSFSHAHNAYFHFLAETGIIGLGLLIFFWVLCYRRILKGYNRTKDHLSEKVYLSSLGAIVAVFAMSLTENYLSATTVNICTSMVLSLAIGSYWQESAQYGRDNIPNKIM